MKIFNRRDKTLLTVKTYLRYNVFESFGLPFPKTYFWRNFTMKKIIAVVLSLAFVLPLTACNNSGVSQEDLDRLQREIDRLENELNQQETNTPSQTEPTNTPEPTEESPANNAALGDTIEFGSINWVVLSVESDRMLVLSDEVLELRPWYHENAPVTWEDSDIRAYLNDSFYQSTFSDQEKGRILEVTNENPSNPNNVFGTWGGPDTMDKVFLLSLDEVHRYMGDNAHVKLRTARVAKYIVTGEAISWNLRSHGRGLHVAGCNHYEDSSCHPEKNWHSIVAVKSNGIIMDDRDTIHPNTEKNGGIRPAMWITLH